MTIFLIVVSLILAVVGFSSLSEATLGVGLIALGCLAGILARLAQAAHQHTELQSKLDTIDSNVNTIDTNVSEILEKQ